MKRVVFAFIAVLSIISCSKKIEGEGVVITETYSASSAIGISVQAEMVLVLSDDVDEGEIRISTYENIYEYLDVVESGELLKIELEDNNYKNADIKIYASAKQFSEIYASGVSEITVKGGYLSFDSYTIDMSGDSTFSVESEVDVDDCTINLSGASSVNAATLNAETISVDLSGNSTAKLSVKSAITGRLSGASVVYYYGDAMVDVSISGAAEVKRVI